MINIYDVLKSPNVTEKSNDIMMYGNYVSFKVDKKANKSMIKTAVEKIFNVSVIGVKTANVLGKKRRVGKSVGKKPDWKKAYVKLKEGDKIDLVEGV